MPVKSDLPSFRSVYTPRWDVELALNATRFQDRHSRRCMLRRVLCQTV